MREHCECISENPGGRPSWSLRYVWSVCYLSFLSQICRSDLWFQGCVWHPHLLTDDIREPYFIRGLSAWFIWGYWSRPLNGCFILVVYFGYIVCFCNASVFETMIQRLEFGVALVGGHDLGSKRTLGCLVFTDWFTCNWDDRSEYEKPERD